MLQKFSLTFNITTMFRPPFHPYPPTKLSPREIKILFAILVGTIILPVFLTSKIPIPSIQN